MAADTTPTRSFAELTEHAANLNTLIRDEANFIAARAEAIAQGKAANRAGAARTLSERIATLVTWTELSEDIEAEIATRFALVDIENAAGEVIERGLTIEQAIAWYVENGRRGDHVVGGLYDDEPLLKLAREAGHNIAIDSSGCVVVR